MNTHKAFRRFAVLAILLAIGACSAQTEKKLLTDEQLAELSVPLDIREYHTTNDVGAQAVFIKLSRLPNGIEDHVNSGSASIVLDIRGPAGAANIDEEALRADPPLSRIRVQRSPQVLRLSLDLERGVVPPYTVHLLADWIMVRLEMPADEG